MTNITSGKRAHPWSLKKSTLDDKRRTYDKLRKRSYRQMQVHMIAWRRGEIGGGYMWPKHEHKAYVKGVRDALNNGPR